MTTIVEEIQSGRRERKSQATCRFI